MLHPYLPRSLFWCFLNLWHAQYKLRFSTMLLNHCILCSVVQPTGEFGLGSLGVYIHKPVHWTQPDATLHQTTSLINRANPPTSAGGFVFRGMCWQWHWPMKLYSRVACPTNALLRMWLCDEAVTLQFEAMRRHQLSGFKRGGNHIVGFDQKFHLQLSFSFSMYLSTAFCFLVTFGNTIRRPSRSSWVWLQIFIHLKF